MPKKKKSKTKKSANINIKVNNLDKIIKEGKKQEKTKFKCTSNNGCGGFAYFLGIIGSAVYFISSTSGFWNIVLAILKSLVWPAFLIFELLKYLGA